MKLESDRLTSILHITSNHDYVESSKLGLIYFVPLNMEPPLTSVLEFYACSFQFLIMSLLFSLFLL